MILHIINPTKDPPTSIPFAPNPRVMLRLVSRAILLVREPALRRLRTPLVPTEEVFAVPVEVFAEVAAAPENGGRRAARVGAAPGSVCEGDAVVA